MKSIGVRELRQHASKYLRLVETGQALEVTARGRTVAVLAPVRHGGNVERLVARGRVVPATGDLLELGPPLRPARGVPRPSDLLDRARANER